MSEFAVEMRGISKHFGGIRALDHVSFSVRRGEVHALLGENGAGKSTLMKILSGAYRRDEGQIRVGGKEVEIGNPHVSRELGIGIIYQELVLAPDLSVAENIFLGELPGLIPWKELQERSQAILRRIGFDLDPKTRLGDLPVAYQQVVEIAKALSKDVRILILDEPTAVLAPPEVKSLLGLVKTLSSSGVSIIYISHRLEEIFQIADAITVIKDGRTIGTVSPKEITSDQLIDMMVGRHVTELFPGGKRKPGEVVLKVDKLRFGKKVEEVSFEARAGEVLGIAGLIGSGRTETARAIFGAEHKDGGTVTLNGRSLSIRSPREAVRQGIGLIPEDRKNQGVVISLPIRENATMAILHRFLGFLGVIKKKAEEETVQGLAKRLAIKMRSIEAPVSSLSGGNQQKVVLSKWFGAGCRVILFDEPTRGVDVGAKAEIYRLIDELAGEGLAVVLISSDLVEVIGMSDRILVMSRGRIAGELPKAEFSEANIMRLALQGLQKDGKVVH
jgi:ribose transport system ATP-binding protein